MISTEQKKKFKAYLFPKDKRAIARKYNVTYGYINNIAAQLSYNPVIANRMNVVADRNLLKIKGKRINKSESNCGVD